MPLKHETLPFCIQCERKEPNGAALFFEALHVKYTYPVSMISNQEHPVQPMFT